MKSIVQSVRDQVNTTKPSSPASSLEQSTDKFSIILIDRKPFSRHCVKLWLQSLWSEARINSVSSPKEISDSFQSLVDVDLIIYNTGSTWVTDLASEIGCLRGSLDKVPLVFMSDSEEADDILEAIDYGARGYITTALSEAAAAEAMHFIRSGGTFIPAYCLVRSLRRRASAEKQGSNGFETERLTRREREVLDLLRQGKPDKIIAYELNISPSTVKVFVRQILLKLHAKNRTEVAYLTGGSFDGAKSHKTV